PPEVTNRLVITPSRHPLPRSLLSTSTTPGKADTGCGIPGAIVIPQRARHAYAREALRDQREESVPRLDCPVGLLQPVKRPVTKTMTDHEARCPQSETRLRKLRKPCQQQEHRHRFG